MITKNPLWSMDTQVGSTVIMQSGMLMVWMIGLSEALEAGEKISLEFKLLDKEQHVQILLPLQIGITGMAVPGYLSILHQSYQFHAIKPKVRIIDFAILIY